jgi:hypothetical protein
MVDPLSRDSLIATYSWRTRRHSGSSYQIPKNPGREKAPTSPQGKAGIAARALDGKTQRLPNRAPWNAERHPTWAPWPIFLQYQSKNRSDPVFRKRNVLPVRVPFIGRGEVLISEFHAVIESRGDGLHPMLRALLVRQAIEMTRLADGMLQAGPGTACETSLQEKRCDPVVPSGPDTYQGR